MDYAYAHAPFYRAKWDEAGIGPADVRSLEDFESVPVVTKEDLRRAQIEHPPFGDYLCVPDSEIQRVHGTSGTTGRPTAFAIGRADWPRIAESHARVMWGMGIRPGDMVFIGAVFSLYMGSWAVLAGAERLGAQAFPFGAGAQGQTPTSRQLAPADAARRPLRHALVRPPHRGGGRRNQGRSSRIRTPNSVSSRASPEHPFPR